MVIKRGENMKKAILARKLGMTQYFMPDGALVPITVLKAGPCVVIQKKSLEKDGYESVKVGFEEKRPKKVTKPYAGQFKKAGVKPSKVVREFRLDDVSALELGDEIKVDIFEAGDRVDVSGLSKGKGFTGVIKRYGLHRGPISHGSKYHRGVGSLSSGTTPGKVKKNKRMSGHKGHAKITVQNLSIIGADTEKGLLLVKGAVPGPRGALIMVRDTVKTNK